MRALTISMLIAFFASITLPTQAEAANRAKVAPAKTVARAGLKAKVRAWAAPLVKRGWQKFEATVEAKTKTGMALRAGVRIGTLAGGLAAVLAGMEAWSRGDTATGGALFGAGINAVAATPHERKGFATDLAIAAVSTTAGAAGGSMLGADTSANLAAGVAVKTAGVALVGVPALFNSAKLILEPSRE